MGFVESTATFTVDRQAGEANCCQRMEKSSRHQQWPALLITFNLLAFVLTVAEGAPASTTTVALPAPPTDGSGMLNDSPGAEWRRTHTEPTSHRISFFKNPKCTLHQGGERNTEVTTTSVVCGLRELDLPESAGSGVRFWTPSRCQRYNCRCIATREEHRQKRTMSDNKVDVTYKRFRVFECV